MAGITFAGLSVVIPERELSTVDGVTAAGRPGSLHRRPRIGEAGALWIPLQPYVGEILVL